MSGSVYYTASEERLCLPFGEVRKSGTVVVVILDFFASVGIPIDRVVMNTSAFKHGLRVR